MKAHGRRPMLRLFAASATLSLIPVLILGLILSTSYRSEARRRGIAEGASEAQLIAQTAIGPQLDGTPLRARLDGEAYTSLVAMTRTAEKEQHILRLRLRSLNGDVVFSGDGSGFTDRPDDEAIDAARGETVARLTRTNSDGNDEGPAGVEAVEVYLPLTTGTHHVRVGVLEIYLPYGPIRADVARGLHQLMLDVVVGLSALYVVLFGISWSISRGLRRQVARNAFLAEYDVLTELPNRRKYVEHITAAVARARARNRSIAVAIVDLDRFKEINDSLGHQNGDAVLREISRRLIATLSPVDAAARLGGDEFGLVLDDVSGIESTLSRIREAITRECDVNGVPVTVEASIGFVVAPDDGDDAHELLQRADIALYVAKGRHSGMARYAPAQDHYDPANLSLITELHHAIDADELALHYQPKARIADGRVGSVEALVRWPHPTRGLLAPDQFLPLVEQTDLIDAFTDWVLHRALAEIRGHHYGRKLDLSVNVSARNMSRHDFPDRVLRALDENRIDPKRLTIEITETALMAEPEKAAIALSQLDAFGVNISLDDFGIGQTSFEYLSALPIDELKIDKTFVSDMIENSTHAAIVRSIIDLGHNLGLRVVAEGIETAEVLRALSQLDCDDAQGFFIARPMPASDLSRFLAAMPAFDANTTSR
jgi:diguanylate cyclase (GGDEF)-like protein